MLCELGAFYWSGQTGEPKLADFHPFASFICADFMAILAGNCKPTTSIPLELGGLFCYYKKVPLIDGLSFGPSGWM